MLNTIRNPFPLLSSCSNAIASSSRSSLLSRPPVPPQGHSLRQVRFMRQNLEPRRVKHRKSMKGLPIKLPTGGAIKGTTISQGDYGVRLLESVRLSAAVLGACRETIRRKLRPLKGTKFWMRVFPDQPICVKGNEVRMGKGKGSLEFWASRVPAGRVLYEIGGPGLRPEIAKQTLKLVQSKLPVRSEFITKDAAPRLGRVTSSELNEVDPREANLILPEFTSVVNQGRAPSSGSMGLQTTAL